MHHSAVEGGMQSDGTGPKEVGGQKKEMCPRDGVAGGLAGTAE